MGQREFIVLIIIAVVILLVVLDIFSRLEKFLINRDLIKKKV